MGVIGSVPDTRRLRGPQFGSDRVFRMTCPRFDVALRALIARVHMLTAKPHGRANGGLANN